MSRKNFLLLILIIVSCVFGITFANYINTLTNDGEVTITINYISEENSVFATLTSLQVDTEIGNGLSVSVKMTAEVVAVLARGANGCPRSVLATKINVCDHYRL